MPDLVVERGDVRTRVGLDVAEQLDLAFLPVRRGNNQRAFGVRPDLRQRDRVANQVPQPRRRDERAEIDELDRALRQSIIRGEEVLHAFDRVGDEKGAVLEEMTDRPERIGEEAIDLEAFERIRANPQHAIRSRQAAANPPLPDIAEFTECGPGALVAPGDQVRGVVRTNRRTREHHRCDVLLWKRAYAAGQKCIQYADLVGALGATARQDY